MSDLLKLREWLGLGDAARYAKKLNLDASVSDIFGVYTELGYPMKLDFKDPRLYVFEPSGDNLSYPHHIDDLDQESSNTWVSEKGSVLRVEVAADIAGTYQQSGYGSEEPVWIKIINKNIALDDFDSDPYRVLPAYWMQGSLDGFYNQHKFLLIKWGNVLHGENNNKILVSRKHIEMIVRRALGQPEPQPAPPVAVQTLALPPYCDASHESYAPELHTALMLWEALYIKNERNPHDQHTGAVTNWLAKNRAILPIAKLAKPRSVALKDRLISITSPLTKKPKK